MKKRKIEVIVKLSTPFENMFQKGNSGKCGIQNAIDKILEQTKECPNVKIIFTNGAGEI